MFDGIKQCVNPLKSTSFFSVVMNIMKKFQSQEPTRGQKMTSPRGTAVGWIVPSPQFVCWSPNTEYFTICLFWRYRCVRTQRKDQVKRQWKGGLLLAKERHFRRKQTCQHLDLGVPASRTVRKLIFCCLTPSLWSFVLAVLESKDRDHIFQTKN